MATTAKKSPQNGQTVPKSPVSGNRIITLDEFIIRAEKDFDFATGELTGLLRDIGVAAKIINREVNKAGLVNIIGVADSGDNAKRRQAAKTRRLCQ
jgi:fructose-1,6-bisphosphatase I